MRIATLQFAPRLGKVESNIRRADELLSRATKRLKDEKRPLDLLVLPEMAFSGYNFPSLNAIKSYLEPTDAGPTAEWARSAARRLGCVVCVGYPELRRRIENRTVDAQKTSEGRFNSCLMVDSAGKTLLNYQKRFLYYTDETWADEGQNGKGYLQLPISDPNSTSAPSTSTAPTKALDEDRFSSTGASSSSSMPTSVGICMDINPYKFLAPYSDYEFATQVLTSGSKLVVLSMAWLTLLTPEELGSGTPLAGKPDLDTFQYWIGRFWPLVSGEKWDGQEVIIVFANRCGEEEGLEEGKDVARYAGTSCVLAVRQPRNNRRGAEGSAAEGGGIDAPKDLAGAEIAVWEMLGRAEEGVCFADTESEPKMVFRIRRPSSD